MIAEVLKEEARRGVPVIFSSHQLELVERLCDRIGILRDGHIIAEGTVDELGAPVGHQLVEIFDALSQPAAMFACRAEPVRRAVALMLEHLEYGWTLDLLAGAVAISKSQLTRLFLRELKSGPAEFLRLQRCQRMAELLVATTDTVESIARQVGWANASHASRAFRSVIGLSPQQYRTFSQEGSLLAH